jgi:hypothetical protein
MLACRLYLINALYHHTADGAIIVCQGQVTPVLYNVMCQGLSAGDALSQVYCAIETWIRGKFLKFPLNTLVVHAATETSIFKMDI